MASWGCMLLLAVHTKTDKAPWPRSCSRPRQLASSICPPGCCLQAKEHQDVCRRPGPEGSHRELRAPFPSPHLQPSESEANKGVHPEEGGGAPEDRLHPFPPQSPLPRRFLALEPLDLLEAEEVTVAVRSDPQPACCSVTQLSTSLLPGLQSLCGPGHCECSSLSLSHTARLQPSAWTSRKVSLLRLLMAVALCMGPSPCLNSYSVLYLHSTYSRPVRVGG